VPTHIAFARDGHAVFANRVISVWNSLSDHIVTSPHALSLT